MNKLTIKLAIGKRNVGRLPKRWEHDIRAVARKRWRRLATVLEKLKENGEDYIQ